MGRYGAGRVQRRSNENYRQAIFLLQVSVEVLREISEEIRFGSQKLNRMMR